MFSPRVAAWAGSVDSPSMPSLVEHLKELDRKDPARAGRFYATLISGDDMKPELNGGHHAGRPDHF